MKNINNELMMTNEISRDVNLSYGIRGNVDGINPEWLTKQMGVEPSWVFRSGERYISRRPDGSGGWKQITSTYPTTIWGYTTKNAVNSIDIKQHFEYLLSILEPRKENIYKLLSRPDLYDISLRLWVDSIDYVFSDTIESDLVIRAVALCHWVDFSVTYNGEF